MNCPHDEAEMISHGDTDLKTGWQHCNVCGCCFLADGQTVRPGHPACRQAVTFEVADEVAKPARRKVNRGTGN